MEINSPKSSLKETKNLADDLLKEVSEVQQIELTHLEAEFENYKLLYPNK